MFRATPNRRAISLIGTPSPRCNRRISAQSSTFNTLQDSGGGQLSENPRGSVFRNRRHACAIELDWMSVVSRRAPGLVPHVYASGRRLGEVDVGWLVLRRAPHHIDSSSHDDCRKLMLAAARFQQVALDIDRMTYPIDAAFFEWCMPEAIEADCPGPGEDVLARLHQDLMWVDEQSPRVRCHGDVHFDNAVSEVPGGPLLLIDPLPRIANWAWDAAYAQMLSGKEGTPRLVPLLAEARRSLGLPTGDPPALERLETILLGWSSMLWWAIKPFRRDDPWFAEQVRWYLERLASSNSP
ncbi:phosphotransferase [Actinopolymorpha sp. B9G3]|uniref:phosphotransferase n=1 Tax=Actinopolymorpha sp. B9G3 TaxID=3158970 RepID=UPI0032D8EC21